MLVETLIKCSNCFTFKICAEVSARQEQKSTVRKKMVAVHFTTIPCELNTTKETNHRHIFTTIVRVLTILCASALTFLTFLSIFISVFSVIVR